MIRNCLTITVLIFVSLHSAAFASQRIALVIGNSDYAHTPRLKNPTNDAILMSKSLESAGFQVTQLLNADQRGMRRALLEFGRNLRLPDIESGVFYYAGHGVSIRGENFLIPIDALVENENEIDLEGIAVNDFLRVMNSTTSKINIVILDACRDNPFEGSTRAIEGGLAPLDAPKGTYISFATAPGQVAVDGNGENSPFTSALSSAIRTPGLRIEDVFKMTRRAVLKATADKQIPWDASSITGDFYFQKKVPAPKLQTANAAGNKRSLASIKSPVSNRAETEWRSVRDSGSIAMLRTFVDRHQGTSYAIYANARILELSVESRKSGPENSTGTTSDIVSSPDAKTHNDKQPGISATTVPFPGSTARLVLNAVPNSPQSVDSAGEKIPKPAGVDLLVAVQIELKRLGCYRGKIDGLWGPASDHALKFYKKHVALNFHGISFYEELRLLKTYDIDDCPPVDSSIGILPDTRSLKQSTTRRKAVRSTLRKRIRKPVATAKKRKSKKAATRKKVWNPRKVKKRRKAGKTVATVAEKKSRTVRKRTKTAKRNKVRKSRKIRLAARQTRRKKARVARKKKATEHKTVFQAARARKKRRERRSSKSNEDRTSCWVANPSNICDP